MATTNSRRDIFPLFDLPRELRDMVYSYLGEEITIRQFWTADDPADDTEDTDPYTLEIRVRDTTRSNVVCVSRQVSAEYTQQIAKQTAVILADNDGQDGWRMRHLKDKRFLTVKRAEYHGFVQCRQCPLNGPKCEAVTDLKHAKDWIKDTLTRLNSDIQLDVHLTIRWHAWHDRPWPDLRHRATLLEAIEDISELRQVQTMAVYRGDPENEDIDAEGRIAPEYLWASWTRIDGWQAAGEKSKMPGKEESRES